MQKTWNLSVILVTATTPLLAFDENTNLDLR